MVSKSSPVRKKRHQQLLKIRRRNILLNSVGIALAIGGALWLCSLFYRHYVYEITDDATIEQYLVPINARISGYVKEINFTEHQRVKAGEVLVAIDDREFKIRLMDARAALEDAISAEAVLQANIATAAKNIAAAEANIEEAKARLWKFEQDLKRYERLSASDAVPRQQYEQAKSDAEAQRAHYKALLGQKESLRSVLDEETRREGSAKAAILRRQADVDMAELNLSYTVITAPYSGSVGRRAIETGQLLQAGQTLTTLVSGEDKWVMANYRETQIAGIVVGQPVRIKVDAISGKVFQGRVTAISEATGAKYSLLPTDNSAGNFVKIQQRIPVRIDFENISSGDMQKLRVGMMVVVEAVKP